MPIQSHDLNFSTPRPLTTDERALLAVTVEAAALARLYALTGYSVPDDVRHALVVLARWNAARVPHAPAPVPLDSLADD